MMRLSGLWLLVLECIPFHLQGGGTGQEGQFQSPPLHSQFVQTRGEIREKKDLAIRFLQVFEKVVLAFISINSKIVQASPVLKVTFSIIHFTIIHNLALLRVNLFIFWFVQTNVVIHLRVFRAIQGSKINFLASKGKSPFNASK